jgi:hypothetical protein
MAKTGKRYHDQLAAETRTHAQEFANCLFINQQFNQWIHYDNQRLGKLVIVNRRAQVHLNHILSPEHQASYKPAEPLELHKPTDLSLLVLLLTPEAITTLALFVNSY